MTDERDRIESAIRHIQTAVDVDPWAVDIAVEAMEEKISRESISFSCNQENDLISRQMLLEYIHGEPVGKLLCDKYNLDGLIEQFPSAQLGFNITVKIDKAYDDGYEAGYLQGRHDWGDLDE